MNAIPIFHRSKINEIMDSKTEALNERLFEKVREERSDRYNQKAGLIKFINFINLSLSSTNHRLSIKRIKDLAKNNEKQEKELKDLEFSMKLASPSLFIQVNIFANRHMKTL